MHAVPVAHIRIVPKQLFGQRNVGSGPAGLAILVKLSGYTITVSV